MDAAISSAGIETLEKRFPKGDVLLDIYSFVNTSAPLELYLEENYPHFAIYAGDDQGLRALRTEEARGERDGLRRPADHWKVLLHRPSGDRESLRRKFRHILVDEYQDTNRLQAEIVDSMASIGGTSWWSATTRSRSTRSAGASFENILTFPLRFPGAAIYKLETNYRSTPQILQLANAAIAQNRFQFPKELRPSAATGPEPALVGVDDVFEQANFVAQRILELRDEGTELSEIAVLYRSHYQSLELQMELARRMIPYDIRSGVRFFEQAHIKDVLAYLRIIGNPRDELSWKRVLKLYPKVGERTAAAVVGRDQPFTRPARAVSPDAAPGQRPCGCGKCRERPRSPPQARLGSDETQSGGGHPPDRRERIRRVRAHEVPQRPGQAR
jgi:DNA helicase II / ATP-dependent DNA helicase PcrA